MASSSRRCTGSSSTMRMSSGMVTPRQLCRIGAPWRSRLNGLLSVGSTPARLNRHASRLCCADNRGSLMPAAAKKKANPAKSVARKAASAPKSGALGALPEWNLADLYPSHDSPQLKRDLDRADTECVAFEEAYKGKLAALAADPAAGAKLAAAVKRYESIDDLLGRLISFASLFYVGNTTDPVRMKFYGDMQERVTAASLPLLFFTRELNRIDDTALENAMADPALGHYRPWIEDVRKEKPYQLEDRVEELFHEKSVTGAGAWNRLFDETIGALRFNVEGKPLAIEATLSLMQDASEKKRRAASEALAKTFKENRRVFTLITNTLAKDKEISDRWRGFKDIADARHLSNRVEPEVVEALVSADT